MLGAAALRRVGTCCLAGDRADQSIRGLPRGGEPRRYAVWPGRAFAAVASDVSSVASFVGRPQAAALSSLLPRRRFASYVVPSRRMEYAMRSRWRASATVAILRRPRDVRTRWPIACSGRASVVRQRLVSTCADWTSAERSALELCLVIAPARWLAALW